MFKLLKALVEFVLSLIITVTGLTFAAAIIASFILGGIGKILIVLGG